MKTNPISNFYIKQNQNNFNKKNVSFESNRVILAGSFDPPTIGHLDLVKVGSQIGDELLVIVGKNPKKNYFLPLEKRLELMKKCVSDFENVKVLTYKDVPSSVINSPHIRLRGLRNSIESLEDEFHLDEQYTLNNPDIRTIFSLGRPEVRDVSSTLVRKLFRENGDFSRWVPKPVAEYLKKLQLEGGIK
ncbi:MAG: pantetheine-phosphate adenylyltransferase [bacterium]|nr:pantetheine-phosphate adenylyltransferase [bacterium]